MISLSKEWALLSRVMYGKEFISELADFLKNHEAKTVLECGCGDGYILQGLAKKGLKGMGIDANPEMISMAKKKHLHPNVDYQQMDWLYLDKLETCFDAVICRGNSLSYVASWGRQKINPSQSKEKIQKSIGLFFQKLKQGGLLYADTISQEELDRKGGIIEIKGPEIDLKGKIEYDWHRKTRKISGSGKVGNEEFNGDSISYLLTPKELEKIILSYKPSFVLHPRLSNERNYDILCAVK